MSTNYYEIHTNSLYLADPIKVKGPLADFSTLKYNINDLKSGKIDRYSCPPFETDTVSREQGNYDYELPKGVHLHFVLPDVFLFQQGERGFWPAPNRWMIMRKRDAKKWLLESDFLSTENTYSNISTLFPIEVFDGNPVLLRRGSKSFTQAHGFMGRCRPMENDSVPNKKRGDFFWPTIYKQPLYSTAYGLASFPLYYPDCQSVFGFHDAEGQGNDEYLVYGWYEGKNGLPEKELKQHAEFSGEESANFKAIKADLESAAHTVVKQQSYVFATQVQVSKGKKGDVDKTLSYTIAMGDSMAGAFNRLLAEAVDATKIADIEEQLELAEMDLITSDYLNPYAEYSFKKHRASFNYKDGGTKWALNLKNTKPLPATSESKPEEAEQKSKNWYTKLLKAGFKTEIKALSNALNALNEVQEKYDYNQSRIASMRYNIFADWQKLIYINHNYESAKGILPRPSIVMNFIRKKIKELNDLIKTTGEIKLKSLQAHQSITDYIEELKANSTSAGLSKDFIKKMETFLKVIGKANAKLLTKEAFKDLSFSIENQPSERYFYPHEPALMFQPSTNKKTNFHPLFMNWSINLTSFDQFMDEQEDISKKVYHTDLIHRFFKMHKGDRDQELQLDRSSAKSTTHHYQGLTMLSGHTAEIVSRQINAAKGNLESLIKQLDKGERKDRATASKKMLETALRKINTKVFGQMLEGFNEALAVRKASIQLPVFDMQICQDIDWGEEEKFVLSVNQAVGDKNLSSPEFKWAFNPLRHGWLSLNTLHLIDSFGRFIPNVNKSSELRIAKDYQRGKNKKALLPTRLIQASRVNMNWLNANSEAGPDDQIINNIPFNNPICGWAIANNLDQSLMIYDTEGHLLGQVMEDNGKIIFFNWKMDTKGIDNIDNQHLKRFVQRFTRENGAHLGYFRDMHQLINQSLEYINPKSIFQHSQYALYANFPVAIVRASIDIETAELYHANHSRSALYESITKGKHITHGYEHIEFPLHIGNERLLEDGVIGYWRKDQPSFYAPKSTLYSLEKDIVQLRKQRDKSITPRVSLAGEALEVTLLMDPRASLTVTSKILPVARLKIPHELFANALNQMQITFMTAPVITPRDKLHLPLMDDHSFTWEWLYHAEKDGAAQTLSRQLYITQALFNQGVAEHIHAPELATPDKSVELVLWDALIKDGWLKKGVGDKYLLQLNQKKKKTQTATTAVPKQYQSLLQMILKSYSKGIMPPVSHPSQQLQEIREGWLQISSSAYSSGE